MAAIKPIMSLIVDKETEKIIQHGRASIGTEVGIISNIRRHV